MPCDVPPLAQHICIFLFRDGCYTVISMFHTVKQYFLAASLNQKLLCLQAIIFSLLEHSRMKRRSAGQHKEPNSNLGVQIKLAIKIF